MPASIFGGGCRVRVDRDVDAEALQRVLEARPRSSRGLVMRPRADGEIDQRDRVRHALSTASVRRLWCDNQTEAVQFLRPLLLSFSDFLDV